MLNISECWDVNKNVNHNFDWYGCTQKGNSQHCKIELAVCTYNQWISMILMWAPLFMHHWVHSHPNCSGFFAVYDSIIRKSGELGLSHVALDTKLAEPMIKFGGPIDVFPWIFMTEELGACSSSLIVTHRHKLRTFSMTFTVTYVLVSTAFFVDGWFFTPSNQPRLLATTCLFLSSVWTNPNIFQMCPSINQHL